MFAPFALKCFAATFAATFSASCRIRWERSPNRAESSAECLPGSSGSVQPEIDLVELTKSMIV